MALYVKKFGGSSVATLEKMRHIVSRVLNDKKEEDQIIIVVSAMGNTTDDLLHLASKVENNPFRNGYVNFYGRTSFYFTYGYDI